MSKPHALRTTAIRVVIMAIVVAVGIGGGLAAAQTAVTVGYQDHSFAGTGAPTAEKPQSKLWFNDGSWWGVLWEPASDDYHVYRFNSQTNTWTDTGTLVDPRHNVKTDALWDGQRLYVASAPQSTSTTDQNAYVRRYSYDAATKKYSLDANFPTKVAGGVMEAIVLDKDSTGKLWATYTQGGKVYVNSSGASDSSWGTPSVPQLKGASNLSSDDISSVVAFDRKTAAPQIGLMWSNQNDDAMYFATRKDGDPAGVWQESRTAIMGPGYADDHINLKSVQADSAGRIFAAVKTSLSNTNQPLIMLLVLGQDGNWSSHVFGRVQDDHTRPIVAIDEENRVLHMFAAAPISPGGVIYHKQTPLDNISFDDQAGLGTPFIKSSTDTHISNATSTKQSVNSKTDLLVLAADVTTDRYLHNTIDIPAAGGGGDTTPPETTINSGPTGTVTSASASFSFSSNETDSTFECALDGAAYGPCSSPADYSTLADGSHTFRVRATDAAGNTDSTPASRSWTVDTTAPTVGGVAPQDGATGVAISANVEVTFSEAMDPARLTTSTFSLTKQGSTTSVAATVTYDAANNKAVLNPGTDLEVGANYTATVKGGIGGAADLAGNPLVSDRTWSFTATTSADTTAPVVQPPAERFPSDTSTGGTSVPVEIRWSATDSENAVVEYQLQQSSDGGSTFSAVSLSSATSTSKVIQLVPGKSYQYRVRAKDAVGNMSDWTYGRDFVIEAFQEINSAIAYTGTWTQEAASSAYGGGTKYATAAGSTARLTFTGREVTWLAARGPDRGRAEVWLDGVKVADIDLYRKGSVQWRRLVFTAQSLDATATHTLEVRVSGTAGRPRVDVDAFLAIR